MTIMDEIVDEYLEEAQRDFISLPMLSCAARQWLDARNTEETRKLSLEMAQRLYEHGLRPGDYNLGTELDYWPDEGCEAMLGRIEREWIAAGEDPNLEFPVCWFGLPER
jgi:hypothetical protein